MSENVEPKLKPGSAEYEADVIKRARKAAQSVGKTLDHYRLMGEALSIMRKRAMKTAGLAGSNKPPSGPKYTKALNEELDKAPEFLLPEVFESGSARTHAIWLHESAAEVEWVFQIVERAKPGATRRWNNPTYIWKQWRKLTKEPTKKELDAKAAKERKAEEMAREVEEYREFWKRKYEDAQAKLDAIEFGEHGEQVAKRRQRKAKAEPEEGGYAPGALEAITGKPKRKRKAHVSPDDAELTPEVAAQYERDRIADDVAP